MTFGRKQNDYSTGARTRREFLSLVRQRMRLALVGCMLLTVASGYAQENLTPTEAVPTSKDGSVATVAEIQLPPLVDNFSPSIHDVELVPGIARAWEYRPYRVAVWMCLDGSPGLSSNYQEIVDSITRRSELIDPSGWDLQVGEAPSQYRWKFLSSLETPEKCQGFETLPLLADYDKLMVVCLGQQFGSTKIRVREFDVQTQQWGPLQNRETANQHQLGAAVMEAIKLAFMPLARVDRVIQKDPAPEVYVQVRATDACYRTELKENLHWEVVPIKDSPVFIKSNDRFLPVIRKTERDGTGLKLEPIDFTFLTIDPPSAKSETEDSSSTELKCSIQSAYRAPLAGRTSKRAEKLALVIRPPEQPTTLYLHSLDKNKTPLEGFDVYSRRPSAVAGESNELLGKTNWEGKLEIPPSEEGLRIILVSRGSRALKRLPMIPGLHESLSTAIPNDETSLYAEGVLTGLEQEILNLVIQRQVFESDIDSALKNKNLSEAKATYQEYSNLESPRDLKTRLTNEEVRLKNLTQDKRELDYIVARFGNLRTLLNKQADNARENELQLEIQKQSNLPGAG